MRHGAYRLHLFIISWVNLISMSDLFNNILNLLGGADFMRSLLVFGILLTAVLIFGFFTWSIIRTKLQNKDKLAALNAALNAPKAREIWLNVKLNTDKALKAIKYLTTYREWRYKTSWYLLCGDVSSGKTSLVHSVTSGRRQHLLLKEKKLVTEGTGWRFFNKAVVIDVEGRYFMASEESTSGAWWNTIVELIQRYRPERPLDGILLTISVESLLKTDGQTRLNDLGDHIYKQLWEIQKQYAFVLPVYIVVTKCDLLDGFNEFWKPFEDSRYDEIFGWSNDHTLDNAFSPVWINKAFSYIEDGLHKAQLDIASSQSNIENLDAFFLFPSHFKNLQKPITALLTKIFEKSVFHESFFFRGLYFTGKVSVPEELDQSKAKHVIGFSNQLFEEKIFSETHLARAVQQSLISRNQLIRRIQLGSIAVLIGLWIWFVLDEISLNRQINTVTTVLRSVQGVTLECMQDTQAVNNLLLQIAEMDGGSLSRLGIPVSWFSSVDKDLSQYLADAVFGKVIFPNMECLFHRKLYDLIYTKIEDSIIENNSVTALNKIRQELEERLDAIVEYERMHAVFNELSIEKTDDSHVLEEFSSVADYLFKRSLPVEFHQKKNLYEKALLKVSYEQGAGLNNKNSPLTKAHIEKYRLLLTARIEKMSMQLQAAIIKNSIMPERLATRIAALQNSDIEKGFSDKPTSFTDDVQHFTLWLESLKTNWLQLVDTQNPCDAIQQKILNFIETAKVYHYPDTRLNKAVNLFGRNACYVPFVKQLIVNRLPGVGQLFYEKENHVLAVKDQANHLIKGSGALEELSYIYIETDVSKPIEFPVLYWDINKLNTALSYYLEYENFLSQSQPNDQGESGSVYKLIAQAKLQRIITSLLREAQLNSIPVNANSALLKPLSIKEERIALQIQNFRKVSAVMQQLTTVFSQLGWRDNYTWLTSVSRLYVIKILEELSGLVEESRLYEVNPKPRWEAGNFVEALYELNNDIQVKDYLNNQKNRIEYIAYNYAEPLISYVINTSDAGSQSGLSVIDKWRNTLNEINRHQRKDPVGKVNQLDQYFLTRLNMLNRNNCAEQLKDISELNRGHDIFSIAQRKIGQSVVQYCQTFNQDMVSSQYILLADAFNKTLAGRYPFSYPLDAGRYEADIDAVKIFFDQYRDSYEGLANRLLLWEKADKNQDIIQFARELEQSAQFFNALFFKNADGTLVQQPVNIRADFRAHPEQAHGSNQIISWMLSNGSDTLVYPDGDDVFNWSPGTPLSLTLKWASGSSFEPIKLAGAWQPEVEDVNATFASGGDWALIHFLQTYKTSGFTKSEILDQENHLLGFNTPLSVRGNSASEAKQTSKTYLRVSLRVIDPKTKQTALLKLPGRFPAYAPDLKG